MKTKNLLIYNTQPAFTTGLIHFLNEDPEYDTELVQSKKELTQLAENYFYPYDVFFFDGSDNEEQLRALIGQASFNNHKLKVACFVESLPAQCFQLLSQIQFSGYFSQGMDRSAILYGIRTMLESGTVFYGKTRKKDCLEIIKRYRRGMKEKERVEACLNPKERLILNFVQQGMTSKLIAEKLKMNQRTVEGYRSRIKRKVQINDGSN